MGIYCLETDQWFGFKDRTSIEPVLRMLELYQKIDFRHRDVATESEFYYFLQTFLQPGFKNYPILYLGFHGYGPEDDQDACIELSDGTYITLKDLEACIDERYFGGVIHFGSCSVVDADNARLEKFVSNTGAVAVCGYRQDIEWLEAAAFEVLMLGTLFQQSGLTRESMKMFDQELEQLAPGLYKRLGFRLVVST